VRLYWEVLVRAFRRAATYRGAALAGMLTNAFFGLLLSSVYRAAYAGRADVAGMSMNDTISALWLSQALISIGAGWVTLDVQHAIRSGDVITDLMRPWDFTGYWLCRGIGERLFLLASRGICTYAIGVIGFGARIPDAMTALAFVPSVALALVLATSFGFIVNVTAFWTIDNTGALLLANIMLGLFSGFLIPLAFFPPWLADIAAVLPFQGITNIPLQLMLGRISGTAVWSAYALQLGWLLAFLGISRALVAAATRRVVIQGG
jgi:ABC-2 type transport system permease protein